MQIASTTNTAFTSITSDLASQDTTSSQSYADIVDSLTQGSTSQTQDVTASDADTDTAVEQFKKDLSTKGAAAFLADENQKKIDALVEKYRQELLDKQAKSPDKSMDIDKMVSDYKEQLMKELEKAQKAEQTKTALPAQALFNTKTAQASTSISSEGSLEQLLSI